MHSTRPSETPPGPYTKPPKVKQADLHQDNLLLTPDHIIHLKWLFQANPTVSRLGKKDYYYLDKDNHPVIVPYERVDLIKSIEAIGEIKLKKIGLPFTK